MLLVKCAYLMALVVWIGAIVFFSFAVAPTVFQVLPREQAGNLTSAVFPIYYAMGSGCGVVLLLSCLWLRRSATSRRLWGVNAVLVAVMLAVNVYTATVVQPRAAELRPQLHVADPPASAKEEFARLHQLAVALNVAVLLGGLGVGGITAAALRP